MKTVDFWYYTADGQLVKYNSFEHLDLVLSAKSIGAPAPKLLSVDVPCGDGELDYTEFNGAVNYANRALSFDFTMIGAANEYLNKYSRLQNLLNGRKMFVTLSEDADFYYIGRVIVNEWRSEKAIGKVTIDVNAEPYKMRKATTVILYTLSSEMVINCKNLKKPVMPKITATLGTAYIKFGEEKIEFAGEYSHKPAVILEEGDNLLTIGAESGTATVMIEYQEGSL